MPGALTVVDLAKMPCHHVDAKVVRVKKMVMFELSISPNA